MRVIVLYFAGGGGGGEGEGWSITYELLPVLYVNLSLVIDHEMSVNSWKFCDLRETSVISLSSLWNVHDSVTVLWPLWICVTSGICINFYVLKFMSVKVP